MSNFVYISLLIVEVVIVLLLPFESLFNNVSFSLTNEQENGHQKFNVFTMLEKSGILLEISDAINAFLVFMFLSFLVYFIKYDMSDTKTQSHQFMSFMSYITMLNGRFLCNYFIAIQLIAIKCASSEGCDHQTSIARVITNSVGICLSLIAIYIQFFFQNMKFPQLKMPWATPSTKYRTIKRFLVLLIPITLAFIDLIVQTINFYLVLMLVLLIKSVMLWIIAFQRASYNYTVRIASTIIESFVWVLYLFAVLIDITGNQADFTYYIVILIASASLSYTIWAVGDKYQQDIFVNASLNLKNATLQMPIIHTIYMLLKFKIGTLEDQQLQYFYCQHMWMCQDHKCPCKTVDDDDLLLIDQPLPNDLSNSNIDNSSNFNQSSAQLVAQNELVALNNNERLSADQRILDKVGELASIDIDDQNEVIQSYKRNKMILEIIFHIAKTGNMQKDTQFLEVFIKTYEYAKVYQVLYELLQMKAQCSSSEDHRTYSYLNYLMYNRTREIELAGKREMFEIDQQLQLYKNFLIYKQLVYESTMLVDKFWQTLKHEDFIMSEIQSLGKQIVESYLDLKKVYDKVIDQNPEFREIVVMSINFYLQVLNFEIEAIQNQNFLANLEQKLKIARENLYMRKDAMRNIGIIVVAEKPTRKNKIALINRAALDIVEYAHEDMIKKDIKILMPSMISRVHDVLVDEFLMSDKTLKDSKERRVMLKTASGNILPVNIRIQTCVSSEKGIFLISYIENIKRVAVGSHQAKIEDAYFMLTDEQHNILYCSQNFSEDFLKGNIYLEDSRINLDDIFMGISKYSETELAMGQRVKFFVDLKSFGFTFDTFNETSKIIDAKLAIKTLHLPKNIIVKEVVFTLDKNYFSQNNKQRKSEQAKDKNNAFTNYLDGQDSQTDGSDSLYQSHQNSSASSNSQSTTNTLLQTKQFIDFQTTPQTITNVQRAVLVYFLILIGTIFAVLAVIIISNSEFEKDRSQVERSVYLMGDFTNLVLSFSFLIQSTYLPLSIRQYSHIEIQTKMMDYFDKVKNFSTQMLDDKYSAQSELQVYMKQNVLELNELTIAGTQTGFNTTFNLGIIQFLTKLETFIRMPEDQFKTQMKDFKISKIKANETSTRRDAWFIIQNGNHNIRNLVIKVGDLYIEEGKLNEGTFRQTVLIITMSCIGITTIAALAFMPVTFALENEEKEILSHWLIVDENVKNEVIANIQEFLFKLEQDKIDCNAQNNIEKKRINEQGSPMDSVMFDASALENNFSVNKAIVLRKDEEESKLSHEFQDTKKPLHGMTIELKKKIQFFDQRQSLQQIETDSLNSALYKNKSQNKFLSQVSDKSKGSKNAKILVKSENHHHENQQHQTTQHQTHTHHEKTTSANVNDTSDEINATILKKETQKKRTAKIFFYGKLKKAGFITAFSSVIIGFYILSYFLTSDLFKESSKSFDFQKTASRRGPCLSNSFIFYLETIQQNMTQRFGEDLVTTEDYILQTCLQFENDFLSYIQSPPNQLKGVRDLLTYSNTYRICGLTFEDSPIEILNCESYLNGLMKNGLSSMIHQVFYYQLNKLRQFESNLPAQRTSEFLSSLELDPDLQRYLKLILDYANIATDYVRQRIDTEIRHYLKTKVDDYVIIFSLFIVFLVACLVYTIRVIVQGLKIIVFRSKILIKIMPTEELRRLYAIKRIQRNRKIRRNQ